MDLRVADSPPACPIAFREILTLEESSDKLLAAQAARRKVFEDTLRGKLKPLG